MTIEGKELEKLILEAARGQNGKTIGDLYKAAGFTEEELNTTTDTLDKSTIEKIGLHDMRDVTPRDLFKESFEKLQKEIKRVDQAKEEKEKAGLAGTAVGKFCMSVVGVAACITGTLTAYAGAVVKFATLGATLLPGLGRELTDLEAQSIGAPTRWDEKRVGMDGKRHNDRVNRLELLGIHIANVGMALLDKTVFAAPTTDNTAHHVGDVGKHVAKLQAARTEATSKGRGPQDH